MATVLGVDASRAGWVGVILGEQGVLGTVLRRTLDDLVTAASLLGEIAVISIDMPIGLPDRNRRDADTIARGLVGARWASVFMTPVRDAIMQDTFAEAGRRNRDLAGEGLSVQAYSLRQRLLDVDEWVRRVTALVVEVHPEVSFMTLAGEPLVDGKKTWAGAHVRRRLLASAGIVLPDDVGEAGQAGVDDVLDAAVASWTAHRVSRGEALSYPDPPQRFSDGLEAAIRA
jgi:predicted RNase H-like nuclease